MGFSEATKHCLRHYADFTGRAARSQYWWFILFLLLGNFATSILDAMVFGVTEEAGPINLVFSLATLLPALAVTARRLHDQDRSGWWQVAPIGLAIVTGICVAMSLNIFAFAAGAAAIVTWLVLLFWMITQGTEGPNRFGPDPLGGSGDHGGSPGEGAPPAKPSRIPTVRRD